MCYSLLALDTGTALDWITPHGARVSARGLASPITHACPPRTLFPYLKCASSSLSIYKLIFMKKLSMITLFNWQIVICLKALESNILSKVEPAGNSAAIPKQEVRAHLAREFCASHWKIKNFNLQRRESKPRGHKFCLHDRSFQTLWERIWRNQKRRRFLRAAKTVK